MKQSDHPLYSTWNRMHERCRNPKHNRYRYYGGRGIAVCERWEDFWAFVEDMGKKPAGTSLDRIDNDKGYSPDNCRWATITQQNRNASTSMRWIIHGNIYNSMKEAEADTGIDMNTIFARTEKGVPGFEKRSAYGDKLLCSRCRVNQRKPLWMEWCEGCRAEVNALEKANG